MAFKFPRPASLLFLLLSGCVAATVVTTGLSTTSYASTKQGSKEDFRVEVGDRVFFDYDEVSLSDYATATLGRQAIWLKQHPTLRIVIEGHADERGAPDYNLALGKRRAAAVRDYLIALGVPVERLSIISYGSERPAVIGSNDAAWGQNRRAVTVPQVQ